MSSEEFMKELATKE
jgi:hypothetical protein